MTFPVLVAPCEGQFAATLVGSPDVRMVGATREEAVVALESGIAHRIECGDLIWLEVSPDGISDLAGKYADDPALREICRDAYRQRDAETG